MRRLEYKALISLLNDSSFLGADFMLFAFSPNPNVVGNKDIFLYCRRD
jgi:hypothetical protein